MSEGERYLFDTCFDNDEARPDASADPAESAPKTFTAEALEQARAEEFAAGRARGRAEAAEAGEQAAAKALEAIAEQAGALFAALGPQVEQHQSEALRAAVTILRKLLPAYTERHGVAEIEALVASCLKRLQEEPRVVIRVRDELLDALGRRLDALKEKNNFEGRIVLLAEDDLAPGEVRVEWADGGAERDNERQWQDIEAIIARGTTPAAAPAAEDEADQAAARPAEAGENVQQSA